MKDSVIIMRLITYLIPFKNKLILICISLFIYSCIILTYPLLNRSLIDDGILNNDFKKVVLVSLSLLALLSINSLVSIFRENLRAELAATLKKRLFNDIFKALMKTHVHFYHKKDTTSLYNDISMDAQKITLICDNNTCFVITQLVGFVGGAIGLMIIDLRLVGIVLIFIPVKFFLIKLFAIKRKQLVEYLMLASNYFATFFGDSTAGTKDIRLYGVQDTIIDKFSINTSKVTATEKKLFVLDEINNSCDFLLMHALEAVLYIIGSYYIFQGSLSIGSLFAFMTYSMQVMNPIASVMNIKYILTGIIPSAKRYFELLDDCLLKREKSGTKRVSSIVQIEFIGVHYSYGNKHVLKDVSFFLKKGDRVAVVGNNGSGKSTLFDIIERFNTPSHGQVIVNAKDYTEYLLSDYRDSIGCMNQCNYIFNLNILQNIKFFRDISDLSLKNTFDKLPEQYFSFILDRKEELAGHRGANLSGGQKQKIALARMLTSEKSLYLLDEPTANLDEAAKEQFRHFLSQAFDSCIVIMITHDSSLLEWANVILQIKDDGSVGIFRSLKDFNAQKAIIV